jgi:hypothetical protein
MNDWQYQLRRGHSTTPERGSCAMDAVNWLVHGVHGDEPECASPVIRYFVTSGNDHMDDATRQRFIPFLHRIAGSRSVEHEYKRANIAVIAASRVFLPMVDVENRERAKIAMDCAVECLSWHYFGAASWAEKVVFLAALSRWKSHTLAVWDAYFITLDEMLRAGPEGEPWSVDATEAGHMAYRNAGGLVTA